MYATSETSELYFDFYRKPLGRDLGELIKWTVA